MENAIMHDWQAFASKRGSDRMAAVPTFGNSVKPDNQHGDNQGDPEAGNLPIL